MNLFWWITFDSDSGAGPAGPGTDAALDRAFSAEGEIEGTTLAQIRASVVYRLGSAVLWTTDEIDTHLANAYQQIAIACGVFYDWTYLENLPPAFSFNQPWEEAYLEPGMYDLGAANFTYADERRQFANEFKAIGPANHTTHVEATDGFLSSAGADTSISATAELPPDTVALTRVSWDKRGIDALEARRLSRVDSRYELTKGEVYGYIWQKDGIRTLRKVRVPAAQSDSVTVTGSWGVMRRTSDLTTVPTTGTWGLPRRIPSHHPIGPERFGSARRPYLEGKNVRVERTRYGRPLDLSTAVCELPGRYALYLRDYAMAMCLARRGPGQDLQLAAHFQDRWTRHLARITRRMQLVDAEHISVMGGDGLPLVTRPPRPKAPWPYGSEVR